MCNTKNVNISLPYNVCCGALYSVQCTLQTLKTHCDRHHLKYKNKCNMFWFQFKSAVHRRRINTKEKAKVIAAVWGSELIHFLAMLAMYVFGTRTI